MNLEEDGFMTASIMQNNTTVYYCILEQDNTLLKNCCQLNTTVLHEKVPLRTNTQGEWPKKFLMNKIFLVMYDDLTLSEVLVTQFDFNKIQSFSLVVTQVIKKKTDPKIISHNFFSPFSVDYRRQITSC